MLKAGREKNQIMYKGKTIKITDFSMENLKQEEHGVSYFRHCMRIISTLEYSTQQNYHS
jgi:hypothetical protein